MRNLIRLKDYTKDEVNIIFEIADALENGEYTNFLKGKTVVMFFSSSSIRTRISFEKGVYLLGGQAILFPTETLDKKEKLEDVIGYLNNWSDAVLVRHKNIEVLDELARYSKLPIINAMTDVNHPCEMLSDLYSLSRMRKNFCEDKFLFVGARGNIGLAWKEASELMGFSLTQCCPSGYEIENIAVENELKKAILDKDIICTDSLSRDMLKAFSEHQVTCDIMKLANANALLNPCPPFYRGEEVSEDVINSHYFAGYEFKKSLLTVQQAIIIFNMTN